MLSIPHGLPVTTIWFSSGIALYCYLILGVGVWPGIALGSFLSNIAAVPLPEALMVATGNTLAPICAFLVIRHAGFRIELDRVRDAVSLVVLGAFASMLPSAAVGPLALVLAGVWPASAFVHVWVVWWSSDVLGILVVTPFLLATHRFWQVLPGIAWWRWLEFVGLLLATFGITVLATWSFSGGFFLIIPIVVLAAWRFQLMGVAPCAVIVSVVSVYAASHGYGLLGPQHVVQNALTLQAFNGTFVLTGLLLAVVITEWRQTRAEMELAYAKLAEAVEHLQESMLPESARLPTLRDLTLKGSRSESSDRR